MMLRYQAPYDWPAMLRFFKARAIPGVEEVDGETYRRTFDFGMVIQGWLTVTVAKGAFTVNITSSQRLKQRPMADHVRRLFDMDAHGKHIAAHLRRDEMLKPLILKRPGLRVPGVWSPFELAVRAILGQQVSVAAASTFAGRIATKFGKHTANGHATLTRFFPTPLELAEVDLSGLGLTTRRAVTVTSFARAMRDDPALLSTGRSLDEFAAGIADLPGLGPWTAHYIAMRMGYPDAFPASDLGVRKALNTTSDKEVLRRAEAWRPYRAYATMHLWASLSD